MNRKTLLAAALAAGSLMGVASVAQAVPAVVAGTYASPAPVYVNPAPVYVNPAPVYNYPAQVYSYPSQPAVVVQAAPPAPIYENVPAPREGYIWAPGHYDWRGGRYTWIQGGWIESRPGYAWQAAHWEQRSDGSWVLVQGNWVQTQNLAAREPWGDRDGDGVINRDDRAPRNPNRY
jgi:hypothetical protein